MGLNKNLNQLIKQLKEGNIAVFDDFYNQSSRHLYYHIYQIARDRQLSDDILQDVYLKILSSLDKYKDETNALAWMITIARNTAINLYNKRKRKVFVDEYDNPNIYGASFNKASQDTPLIDLMHEVLNEKQKEVVILYLINDFTHQEIANHLKRPLGTVLWQYNQAIKLLRKKAGEKDEISK